MNRKKSKSTWLRLTSAMCIATLCLTFFVGCNESVSNEEIDSLKKDLLIANKNLKTLQETHDATLQENEALSGANEAANLEIETLKAENEAAKQEITSLKSDSEAAKQEIDALKSENEAVKQEIASTLKELESLKEQMNDLLNYISPDSSEEKIRIYIDQGHNPTSYHNSGASGNGLYEEDLTFTIGRLLAGLLVFDGRFEACLSRPTANTVLGTDNASSLEARVQGAKDFEADYFISLHINSFDSESAHGIEVLVAEGSGTSYDFGSCILSELIDATELRNRDVKTRPELYVLKNATMPAVLVEMGFISNPSDAELLSQHPEYFAQGIYNGILSYFDLQPKS